MTQPVKFAFDTVFDVAGDDGFGTANSHTAEEVEAACQDAHRTGFADGTAQEQATIQNRHSHALAAIATSLADIARTQNAVAEHTIKESTTLALAIAGKIASEMMQRQPLAEVAALVKDCLHQLADEPRVVVRVPDALLDPLGADIDAIAGSCGFAGRVVLVADPSLGETDCHVEWADGGAERDRDAIWRDIEAGIGRMLDAPIEDPVGEALECYVEPPVPEEPVAGDPNAAPAEEAPEHPVETTDAAPAEEAPEHPVETIDAAPAEETPEHPVETTDAAPAEEAPEHPASAIDAAPAGEAAPDSDDIPGADAPETQPPTE